jgi:hypothetical protein
MKASVKLHKLFTDPPHCGLKGGNSRCQQKERKRPRKNQRRKRSTNALVRFTAPKIFWSHNPNFNPGGEFHFSSRSFLRDYVVAPRAFAAEFATSLAVGDGGSYSLSFPA